MSFIVDSNKRKWFSYLNRKERKNNMQSLFSHFSHIKYNNRLIVALKKNNYLFTIFDTYLEFYKYMKDIPINERCFFEVIPGNIQQKPRFDIEISDKHPSFEKYTNNGFSVALDNIIKSILSVEPRIDVEKDILLFNSSGKNKISYHIVINNFFHNNKAEAKYFYDKVMENLPKDYCTFIDRAVYSSMQQFRIINSQKYQSGRIKKLVHEWKFEDKIIRVKYPEPPENEDHKNIMELGMSLITQTSDCLLIPIDIQKTLNEIIWEDLEKEQVTKAFELLKQGLGFENVYEISDVKESMIILKRLKPSYCKTCKRIHEAENGFILVINNYAYYSCRRSEKKTLLGPLKEQKQIENIELKKTNIILTEKHILDIKLYNNVTMKINDKSEQLSPIDKIEPNVGIKVNRKDISMTENDNKSFILDRPQRNNSGRGKKKNSPTKDEKCLEHLKKKIETIKPTHDQKREIKNNSSCTDFNIDRICISSK